MEETPSTTQLPIGGDMVTAQVGEQASIIAVGKQITQVVYQGVILPPLDEATLATANAKLAQLLVDTIPPIETLPPGSRMPFSMNPLFVGREADLKKLAAALKSGRTVAVGQIAAATGLGGIGKTQLAVAFVHHFGQFFAGGVYWLNFSNPLDVPTEIARCGAAMPDLRIDFATLDLETQVRLVLAAWQSSLPRLLVFDNCEEPALLDQWRPPTGGSRVLVTSRRRNWDAALGVQVLALDTLPRGQSIDLLRKFRPDLTATDPALDQIAAELGDLPLALHLAGSYLARYRTVVSPASYLAQLRNPDLLQHRSLQAGDLSPTGHVQHVERTFALSLEKLNSLDPIDILAKRLLARASWFESDRPILRNLLLATIKLDKQEGALQVEDAVRRLTDLGLINVDTEGSLLLHRLVTQAVKRSASDEVKAALSEAIALAINAEVTVTLYGYKVIVNYEYSTRIVANDFVILLAGLGLKCTWNASFIDGEDEEWTFPPGDTEIHEREVLTALQTRLK